MPCAVWETLPATQPSALGDAGGLEARVSVQDRRQWDDQISPPGAVELSIDSKHSLCLLSMNKVAVLCVCVCMRVYMLTGRLEE